jgi:hypothetical protein
MTTAATACATVGGYLGTLLAMGLSEQRRLIHMRLGQPALPGERQLLLAQASYAAG